MDGKERTLIKSKSRLNILILTHNYIRFPGDHAGNFVHILAKGLVQGGHKVFVLAPHQRGLKIQEKVDDVRVHRFRYAPDGKQRLAYRGNMHELVARSWVNKLLFSSFLIRFFVKALSLSLRKRVDLISAQWWIPAGLIGYWVSLLVQRPLFITSHGTDIRLLEKKGISSRLAGLVFRRAKRVTTVSSFLKKRLSRAVKLPPERIRVIPMPVTPETFKPTPLKDEKVKLILCVSRFTPQKGLDVFLKACKMLQEKGVNFRAKIVGEGPLKDFLALQIKELNLQEHLFLLDTIPQHKLNLLYAESSLVVLPSVEEGFGLVLVEAQLCKRPVVGTRSGGIPDIIQDGESGILFPPGDHLGLASAMERILTDHRLAFRLAEGGYKSAMEKFAPEAVLQKYLEVLT